MCTVPMSAAQTLPPPPKQSNLPTLGDTEREALSPLMERKLGEEIMNDIRRDHDFLDDDPILEYLNNFGNALVDARPGARGEANFDFYFFCLRDTQLNAFALPGGFIAVHSALLLAAQSESELASVLGHEIGHVVQRHIARQLGKQRQDVLIPLAAIILAVLAAKAGGGGDVGLGVFAAGQGLAIQRQLNFGRDAEREADRVGFQIMGAAGFDTSGMVAFFQRLQTSMRNYSDFTPAWLQSHPLTTERIADIQARIREQPYKQRLDSEDFYLVRSRARVLQDDSAQGLVDATVFFDNQMLQQSRQQTAAAQYGMAFVALKRGDTAAAQGWLDKARATVDKVTPGVYGAAKPVAPSSIFAYTELEIELAQSKDPVMLKKALADADLARGRFPLSRGIAHKYAEALIAAGQAELAAHYLRDQVQLYKAEPELYDLLAQAYSALGKQALQHLALAESYVLQGGVLSALDQLALGRKAPDASFYDQAVIDARERELQARQRDIMGEKDKRDLMVQAPGFKVEASTTGKDKDKGVDADAAHGFHSRLSPAPFRDLDALHKSNQ
ncbi:M48 family metalloprotease [Rugamonas sp.]|uniref:beta-barrel assembly-enhancing protease n=1 Tax=Rugamonas sp. TaxID=1926287 RepID=UPI0025DA6AA4|nr:M48 family metalloprotease [Rugamonas sp.]